MKTKEEKDAARLASTIAALTSPSGARPTEDLSLPADMPSPAMSGLKLSDIQLKPLDFFHDHPSNHVFDEAKARSPSYWRDLKRDIDEARAIINPVITLGDGTIVEGHSRIRIARELAAEKRDIGKIPTRIIASEVSEEEIERRVYLGNLSRFEVDEDTRLALYAQVWPGYFGTEGSAGRPSKSYHGDTISAGTIAAAVGKSEVQVKRDRATVRVATELARAEGLPAPKTRHVAEARSKANALRKTRVETRGACSEDVRTVVLRLTVDEAKVLYDALADHWKDAVPTGPQRALLDKLAKDCGPSRQDKTGPETREDSNSPPSCSAGREGALE
jgi:hypothetical protein